MTRIPDHSCEDEAYKQLAYAICYMAVHDWKSDYVYLNRKTKRKKYAETVHRKEADMIISEKFFRSATFAIFMQDYEVDPDKLLERLKEQAEEELAKEERNEHTGKRG